MGIVRVSEMDMCCGGGGHGANEEWRNSWCVSCVTCVQHTV